ncbi:MAG: hypothetical protein R2729_00005, partial [Bryobacteraceae bacterium]
MESVWPSRATIAAEQESSFETERNRILRRWRGVLTAEEERNVRSSKNRDRPEFRFKIMQRVRFVVIEPLAGPSAKAAPAG